MTITLEIPEYSKEQGINYKWEENFHIETSLEKGCLKISANAAGLISLANHLLNLAQEEIPSGHHLHFDEDNSLEKDSLELIVEKISPSN